MMIKRVFVIAGAFLVLVVGLGTLTRPFITAATEPSILLRAFSQCSYDYDNWRDWRVVNDNPEEVRFTWCLKWQGDPVVLGKPICSGQEIGGVPDKYGSYLYIPAHGELHFKTPAVAGPNVVLIYSIDGRLDAEVLSWEPCDCAGEPGGFRVLDDFGGCCLPGEIDKCGVCFGTDKCLDCLGIPFGTAVFDDFGACCQPEEIDMCGVCFGDSSSCMCTEESILVEKRKIRRANRVLLNRTKQFAERGLSCRGSQSAYASAVLRSERLFRRIVRVMNRNFANNILQCAQGICTQENTGSVINRLNRLTRQLGNNAKGTKIRAIVDCRIEHSSRDNRKRSDDYTNDALKTLEGLPTIVSKC